jgi:hypothetical protein
VLALFPQPTPSAEPRGQYAQVAGRTLCVVCWRFDGEHDDIPSIGHIGTPQATPSAELVDAAQAWGDGFEAGATWPQSTPSGVPIDPPINPYEADRLPSAAPPSIADMASGTTFTEASDGWPRSTWEVGAHIDGTRYIVRLSDGWARDPKGIDPSTIRDVTPPPATPKENDDV